MNGRDMMAVGWANEGAHEEQGFVGRRRLLWAKVAVFKPLLQGILRLLSSTPFHQTFPTSWLHIPQVSIWTIV
jgi:hypothetical protein